MQEKKEVEIARAESGGVRTREVGVETVTMMMTVMTFHWMMTTVMIT
jgi:hypothetical protein